MHVALGESAGFDLGVLGKMKMMTERLILAVGLGGETGSQNCLSVHVSACGVKDLALDKQALG